MSHPEHHCQRSDSSNIGEDTADDLELTRVARGEFRARGKGGSHQPHSVGAKCMGDDTRARSARQRQADPTKATSIPMIMKTSEAFMS